jgi:hypothetical protein
MLFRLFAPALLLLVASGVAVWFLGFFAPGLLETTLFAALGQQARGLAGPAYYILSAAALLVALYQGFQLWRWHEGKADVCQNCGGMVAMRDGRYGPYVRCLACGTTRSLR